MTEPLLLAFDVRCTAEHAFETWTSRIATWWPADHSVSGNPVAVVLEPHVGGRLFERTPDGTEHDWGEVTSWDPPRRLAYRWHLGRSPEAATDVEIRFEAVDAVTTHVVIEHRNWERLGSSGDKWRDRNKSGWESLLPHYRSAVEKEGA